MAATDKEIGDLIGILANNKPPGFSYFDIGIVESVDVKQRTCTVRVVGGSGITLQDVRLMATLDDGFLLVPTVDTNVIVGRDPNQQASVLMCSELDMIWCVVGDQQLRMKPEGIEIFNDYHRIDIQNEGVTISNDDYKILLNQQGITFNDGSFGGLIKIAELTARLNNIEEKYNDLAGKWNVFCDAYVPGGPLAIGSPAELTASKVDESSTTEQSQLENELIKHGV